MKQVFQLVVGLFIFFPSAKAQMNLRCDSVRNKILEIAHRHVDSEQSMKTEFVAKAFSSRDCFSEAAVAELYETEFIKYIELQKSSWKHWKPSAGWIATFCLALFLLLKDFIKSTCRFGLRLFGGWIYMRLAGSRLLRRFAIKNYQAALAKRYSKVKIVFRSLRPLNMADGFVPLKVLDSLESRQMDVLEAARIFDKIVVVGDPGAGKSMLCKNLLYSYGKGSWHLSSIPVLVELHRLNDPSTTILQLLVQEFSRSNFPNAENFVLRNLETGRLFLLFDGYDEINTTNRAGATEKIKDFIEKYPKSQLIITSRLAVYRNEFSTVVERVLNMVEFSHQQIRAFLESWRTDMPADKSIDQLMITLQERPRIMAMATNPLLLTIIAYLYTDTPLKFPHSRGEFYEKATDILLSQWHTEHNQFDARDKALILQRLAFAIQSAA
ncbi:MAG: NACHT domain-containing protein, partial [Chitinophagaceae bacterium]